MLVFISLSFFFAKEARVPRVSVSFSPRRTKGVGDHILASPVLLVFRRGGGARKR